MKAILSMGLVLGLGSVTNLAYGDLTQTDSCRVTMKDQKTGKTGQISISFEDSAAGQPSMTVIDGDQSSSQIALNDAKTTESDMTMTDEDVQQINQMISKLGGQPVSFKASDVASAHWEIGADPNNEGVFYTILQLNGKDGQPIAKLGGMEVLIMPFLSPCQ